MLRRSFLLGAGAALALGSAAAYRRWQEITPLIHAPGRMEGHFLRDLKTLPAPSHEVKTDVAILGSGVAGLTAAWKLNREGHGNFLVIDGPQAYGNAAGGSYGDLAYPTGAHYLPLPTAESMHVRELLHDLGILLRNPSSAHPYYDERFLLHGPHERVLFEGKWHEGLLPKEGLPAWELQEHERFAALTAKLRQERGTDGKRLFALPSAASSNDPSMQALDRIGMKQWLQQNGFRSPTLHWYVDYGCRDDYGISHDQTSAWAGLHYFCSRGGGAENAEDGTLLTWPGGLSPLAAAMDKAAGSRRRPGTVISVKEAAAGVEAVCAEFEAGQVRSFVVKARRAICAMPLFVAARVMPSLRAFGFDPQSHMPSYAPWLVANFLMKEFPQERPEAPLSWDNVVHGSKGLGYVLSTHQDIRVTPPGKTVFTAYHALAGQTPRQARAWLDSAAPEALLELASQDMHAAYGMQFSRCVERADITLRAHAMCSPLPGFRSNAGLHALREADGAILFAHADLSGFSVFEEAAWWGYQAALKVLGRS
jgi:hypothetical protein